MLTQTTGVTAEPSGDRIIALDAAGETMLTLSPVGALIWTYLTEPRELDDIVEHLTSLFGDVPREQLATDASTFVAELLDVGLVTEN